MRATLSHNPLHNPFANRFNDPVTRRLDEMQTQEYMAWLKQRSEEAAFHSKQLSSTIRNLHSSMSERLFAGGLVLLILLVWGAFFLKSF